MIIDVTTEAGEKTFGTTFKNLYILNENSKGTIIINDNEQYNVEDIDLLEDVDVYKINWNLEQLGRLVLFLSNAYLKLRKLKVVTVDYDIQQKVLSERFSLSNTRRSHTVTLAGEDGKVKTIEGIILTGTRIGGSKLDVCSYLDMGSGDIKIYEAVYDSAVGDIKIDEAVYDLQATEGDLIWINGDSNWAADDQVPSAATYQNLLNSIELRSSQHRLKLEVTGSGTSITGDYNVVVIYKERELVL